MSLRYRVLGRTSVRKSLDPDSPDYEVWANFEPGRTYSQWPDHAPVKEWVSSGHWQPVKDDPVERPSERLSIEGEGRRG